MGRRRAGAGAWMAVAVVLVSLNLRGPVVALPSVSGRIEGDLAVGAGAVGVLTTVPVVCFALATPLASALIARAGLRVAVTACLAGVAAGTLVRSAGGYALAVTGTVVLGTAITVGNIALPVVVGEQFPARVGLVTALYTAGLNVGSAMTASLTAPIAAVVGWRAALVAWVAFAAVAALAWAGATRVGRRSALAGGAGAHRGEAGVLQEGAGEGETGARAGEAGEGEGGHGGAPSRPVWRRPVTWGLATAFAGQAFSFYGTAAWLPDLLAQEQGLSASAAGAAASLFQVSAIAGAFGVPALLRAGGRLPLVLVVVCAAWLTLPLGLLLTPGAWWLWCLLAGAAQGGGITVLFVAVTERTSGADARRATSAIVQGVGYGVGALGSTVVGAVHDATRSWTAPLAVIAASVVVLLVSGTWALRGPRPPAPSAEGSRTVGR